MAGIGFGSAGVHLAHAMSYPVSGMVRDYRPDGYPVPHPLVPHGMSVALDAPAVFRFTAPAAPERHRRAAELIGLEVGRRTTTSARRSPTALTDLLRKLGMPNGLSAVGYGPDDLDDLVAGTLPQHTVTKLSPRPASARGPAPHVRGVADALVKPERPREDLAWRRTAFARRAGPRRTKGPGACMAPGPFVTPCLSQTGGRDFAGMISKTMIVMSGKKIARMTQSSGLRPLLAAIMYVK